MLINILIGIALSIAISSAVGNTVGDAVEAFIELSIRITSYYHAREEIRQKAQAALGQDKDILLTYIEQMPKVYGEEILMVKVLERRTQKHIANIKVTAAKGTPLRVGECF